MSAPVADRVLVFAGGDRCRPEDLDGLPADALVVAADSGAEHAVALGWSVDVLVGDLDSIGPELAARLEAAGTRVLRHPEAKDQTDLALTAFRRLFDHVDEVAPHHVVAADPLDDRIVGIVDQRLRLHAAAHGVARVFRSLAVDDPVIGDELRVQRCRARCEVAELFAPELDALDDDRRTDLLAVLDVSTSFDHLDLLTTEHGLPPERVRRLVVDVLRDQFVGAATTPVSV